MLLRFSGAVAHIAAVFGVFWLLALAAHLIGIYEDPRIVEMARMASWERAVIVLWGLAALEWWGWRRMPRG